MERYKIVQALHPEVLEICVTEYLSNWRLLTWGIYVRPRSDYDTVFYYQAVYK